MPTRIHSLVWIPSPDDVNSTDSEVGKGDEGEAQVSHCHNHNIEMCAVLVLINVGIDDLSSHHDMKCYVYWA